MASLMSEVRKPENIVICLGIALIVVGMLLDKVMQNVWMSLISIFGAVILASMWQVKYPGLNLALNLTILIRKIL